MTEKPDNVDNLDALQLKHSQPASAVSDTRKGDIPNARPWTRRASLLLCAASIFLAWICLHYTTKRHGHIVARLNGPYDSEYLSLSINVTHFYNNKAAGPGADFDPHSHGAYPAEYLPTEFLTWDRIKVRTAPLLRSVIVVV